MRVYVGTALTPTEAIADAAVAVEAGRIAYVGPRAAAPEAVCNAPVPPDAAPGAHRYLLPGLVDLHNHGGGGVSFPEARSRADVRLAVAAHRAQGTRHLLASLVSAPGEELLAQVEILADAARAGDIAGIHLEGPFISGDFGGAHDPRAITGGDPDLLRELLTRGEGHVRTITLAPESPRFSEVLEEACQGGAVPSLGHTGASAAVMREGLAAARRRLASAGAKPTVTHLFNAMAPLHHRDPGPILPALGAAARGEAVVELIGDGVHLHPDTVREVFDLVGADNIALVTDAMAGAGMPPGHYTLGGRAVVVDGEARLVEGGGLAGGTGRLLDVVRAAVGAGVGLVEAVRSASLVPARVIDPQARFGALRPGYAADVICVDQDLRIIDG